MQNKANSNSGCNGAKQGSNCVIWTGQAIPALGIEKGDSMTDITCTIAQQVVTLAAPLDLSTVSIQCLIDNLGAKEPTTRTLATMLQIAYDSTCTLNETVEAIQAQLSAQSAAGALTLNLGCLATFDTYGNVQPYNQQSVLQSLITTACGQATTITGLSGNIQTLQAAVTALQNVPQYTEPSLSSCLYSNTKTSNALQLTAAALCAYQGEVGQVTDIQSAMARMPASFTATYGLTNGWIVNPTSLAQSYNNALIVIANLATAITSIQNTCCQVSCADVVVDFDVSLSSNRLTATLFFAIKSSVPPGFSEVNSQGDLLTITDGNGAVYQTYINVIQQLSNPNGKVIDLSGTALDPSTTYTFNLTTSLTNGTLTCVKCVTKEAVFSDTCSFCTISVTSAANNATDKITIVYNVPGGAVQYASIYANQTQAIPANAIIQSLIVYGTASYTSTCTLPSPSIATCYEMSWAFSKSSGNADAVFTDAEFIYLSVLGQQYPINCGGSSGNTTQCYSAVFTNFYPSIVGLISNVNWTYNPTANIQSFKMYFLTTSAIAATMEGFIGNPNAANGSGDGFDAGAYFKAIPSSSTSCPSTTVITPGGGGGTGT